MRQLVVHVGTWNVNGEAPQGESLIPWLEFSSQSSSGGVEMCKADMVVLGFQEIVVLSPQQVGHRVLFVF